MTASAGAQFGTAQVFDSPKLKFRSTRGAQGTAPDRPVVGTSSAARVSIGSKHDDWAGLAVKGRQLKRHPTERVTVTVVIYNAVAGGVPSEADVVAAIDDMEQLYASTTGGSGRLVDRAFDVFKNGGSSKLYGHITGCRSHLPSASPRRPN